MYYLGQVLAVLDLKVQEKILHLQQVKLLKLQLMQQKNMG